MADNGIQIVIGMGGGSAIDSAKAIAALAVADTDNCWDLVVARKPITKALAVFAIPTMASTGSEMDASCVISNLETEQKTGYNGPAIRPKVTFDDPTNTFSVPPYQTACGAIDIMSHTIDTKYFSKDDKMDMLYRMMDEHVKTVVKWAPVAYNEPDNYEARSNLMWAASWALNSFMTCGVRQMTSVQRDTLIGRIQETLGGQSFHAVYNKILNGHWPNRQVEIAIRELEGMTNNC